jgi:hypothetical protein
MKRTCPVTGCASGCGADQLVCKRHWFKLPKPVRDEIWRLWRNERGSTEQRTFALDAVRQLNAIEGA